MNDNLLSYSDIRSAEPWRQALTIGATGLLFILLWGIISAHEEVEWFISICTLGFFAWANSVISFFCFEKQLRYTLESIGCFAFLSAFFYSISTFFSSMVLGDHKEYVLMFGVTVCFYVCALLIAAIIREVAKIMGVKY